MKQIPDPKTGGFVSELSSWVRHRTKAMIAGIDSLWQRAVVWAEKETSRSLSRIDDVPEVTGRRMLSVMVRSVPFMRPMAIHIVAMIIFGLAMTAIFTFLGLMTSDMWDNKMMVNDKMQPFQAFVLFVDDTYVREEFLTEEELLAVEEAGFAGEDLTQDQRKTIRNRMLIWFFIGDVFWVVVGGFLRYYPAWIWQNVNHYLRVAMVERLEHLSLSFHNTSRAGDAIYRIYQDSSMVVNVLQEVIISPVEDLYRLFIIFLLLFALDPVLAGVVFLAFVPMTLIAAKGTRYIRKLSVANRVLNSDLTSRLQEIFAAIKIFKANTAETTAMDRFEVDSSKALDAALYVRFGMILLSVLVGFIGGLTVIVIEYFLVEWTVYEQATAVPGWLIAFVGLQVWNLAAYYRANEYVGTLTGYARGYVRVWCMWQDLFIGLERAFYFLDLKPIVFDPEDPSQFPATVQRVRWENVHYQYEEEKPVLEGVSLEANSGEITAIVGNTGSGKSTLLSLLLRIYDPQQGQVMINDTVLPDFLIDDIRSHVAIAMQKNILFTGKIRENISFGLEDVPIEQVVQAAEVACAHEFIMELADGYETELGERGAKLSAGQRQRLTLARAVIRDTPILILDEPTASLDAKTEHQVISNLAEWGKEKVVFLITHRLSTIRNADRIAFLEDGQIVEVGTHDELMQRAGGRYRNFVNAEEVATSV